MKPGNPSRFVRVHPHSNLILEKQRYSGNGAVPYHLALRNPVAGLIVIPYMLAYFYYTDKAASVRQRILVTSRSKWRKR